MPQFRCYINDEHDAFEAYGRRRYIAALLRALARELEEGGNERGLIIDHNGNETGRYWEEATFAEKRAAREEAKERARQAKRFILSCVPEEGL